MTGATGGIGHAIARALHARGAKLIASGRKRDVLEELAPSCRRSRRWSPTSPTRRRCAALAPGGADRRAGRECRAARVGTARRLHAEEIDRALDVNLRAPMQLARALVPRDGRARRRATSCSSPRSPARCERRGSSVYSATKFGLRGFGFSLNEELRGTGVGVTTVFPGFIRDAGMFAESGAKLPRGVGTRTPEEVASAVIRGIEKNRAEIDVAPISLRSGARLFGVAPGLVAAVNRRARAPIRCAEALAEGQRDKR